ncbi:SPOR domain-containing protein [Sphingomonas bacterium]|uniref:SPOR domain-containing protein n=1 Tax=Sphingomonas bacterium TaxID=1895847 RepID=UPI001575AB23|nr:SPOR domain-containing protein [Sphingomonas bacterium]
MNTRTLLPIALSALMLGGAAGDFGIASASDHATDAAAKDAVQDAARAEKALARHDGPGAVGSAESAVGAAPRDVAYRLLLAQSYIQAGRFASARQAYADVLQLSPGNGKAALNQALATIATGDWQAARAQLADHADIIPVRDRGLALALAGDTQGAITLLTTLVRSPAGDAKARQNLALSFALAGQWQAARLVAGMDLAGDQLDSRLQQWAGFAQPAAASDQVATLLGVHATVDHGQPVALALHMQTPPVAVAAVAPSPVVASASVEPLPVAASTAVAATATAGPVFAPRREVVQSLPVVTIPAMKGATKVAAVPSPSRTIAKGPFVVQIGAFANAGVARDAWGRARHMLGDMGSRIPQGMTFAARSGTFYRLSVGGFVRTDANALCDRYRAHGGACFVRKDAGDRVAQWVAKANTQVASR